jgi:hypothetical protein
MICLCNVSEFKRNAENGLAFFLFKIFKNFLFWPGEKSMIIIVNEISHAGNKN